MFSDIYEKTIIFYNIYHKLSFFLIYFKIFEYNAFFYHILKIKVPYVTFYRKFFINFKLKNIIPYVLQFINSIPFNIMLTVY